MHAIDSQPSNISFIHSTLDVSNEDKSRVTRDLHSENIPPMPITEDVSNCEKSTLASDRQFINIPPIAVTEDVSSEDKSRSSTYGKLENKYVEYPRATTRPSNVTDLTLSPNACQGQKSGVWLTLLGSVPSTMVSVPLESRDQSQVPHVPLAVIIMHSFHVPQHREPCSWMPNYSSPIGSPWFVTDGRFPRTLACVPSPPRSAARRHATSTSWNGLPRSRVQTDTS